MRIDAYTHFIPKKFFEAVEKMPGAGKDIGKRMRGVPCVYDLDERRRIVGMFKDYAQILSYPMPPIENFAAPGEVDNLCRLINDGFAEIVASTTEFPGFVAQVSLASPAGAVKEAERAVKELGACGIQIYSNVNGTPIDRPQYEESGRSWRNSTGRSGFIRHAPPSGRITSMRRNRSTRSGGR